MLDSSSSFKPRIIVFPLPSNELPRVTDSIACVNARNTAWVGMTALEMIQKVAMMTVNSPIYQTQDEARFHCGRLLIESFVTDPTPQQQDIKVHAGEKRKRDCTDANIELDFDEEDLAEIIKSVDMQPSDYTFHRWTPILPVGQLNSSRLDFLVREFERTIVLSNIEWCLPLYNRVQRAFLSEIARVGGDFEKRLIAVNNAVLQMQLLVDMVSIQPKSADLSSKTNMKMQSVNFNRHMTTWITRNWQNPFPDDEMLEHLSDFFIVNRLVSLSQKDTTRLNGGETMVSIASEKINNWLVNFRSRRWRPVRYYASVASNCIP